MSNVVSLAGWRIACKPAPGDKAADLASRPAPDPERAARAMVEELMMMIECIEVAIAAHDLITARHALGEIIATTPPEAAPLRVLHWRRRHVLRLTLQLVNAECAAG